MGSTCPPWCTKHNDEHNVHGSEWRRVPGGIVSILQAAHRSGPSLYIGGVRVDVDEAGLLAGLMARLGHPDVAAAILETAALVTAEPVPDANPVTGTGPGASTGDGADPIMKRIRWPHRAGLDPSRFVIVRRVSLVREQVSGQVTGQVYDQVARQVRGQVDDQVDDQVDAVIRELTQ
jgi:hypothetical protein